MSTARQELVRITASVTVFCAVGGVVLGGLYLATNRYQEAARADFERRAIQEMLGLDGGAAVTEVQQYLDPVRRTVIYRALPVGGGEGAATEVAFTLEGETLEGGPAGGAGGAELERLGRFFVARRGGTPVGFVVEGEARGYKNVIRFFLALDASFRVAGVRVVEHEEDPGLGAEVASRWFQGQYLGRSAEELRGLEVTKDPMPEDWASALKELGRVPMDVWRERHGELAGRERARPIYAVTGATISSEALTDGLRNTVRHFQYRWALLEPHLGGAS